MSTITRKPWARRMGRLCILNACSPARAEKPGDSGGRTMLEPMSKHLFLRPGLSLLLAVASAAAAAAPAPSVPERGDLLAYWRAQGLQPVHTRGLDLLYVR